MRSILLIISLFLGIVSCTNAPIARPTGFMRIGLPASDSSIALTSDFCGFNAQIKDHVKVTYTDSVNCWVDLVYPDIKSTIQLTYKTIDSNLDELLVEAQKLAYKHTVKATGMREQEFSYQDSHVYGMYYEMSGASATTTQFYATDSNSHFLRGVMYHYSAPNPDSLAPVTDFMRSEILSFISSLQWKYGE
ncbi:MAG: gliding motility lipoprotein GldD [Schleiferiaceae bacterium]|nr:gliding motility lipoprotein GldD [Schleiferiaceae bacterium]